MSRETTTHSIQEIYNDKEKEDGDRFTREMSEYLLSQFEKTGDITPDFSTHAFPIENLPGIVKHGGLKPAVFTEIGDVKTPGSHYDPTGTLKYDDPREHHGGVDISWAVGFVQSVYSRSSGSEAVWLFPNAETERVSRLINNPNKKMLPWKNLDRESHPDIAESIFSDSRRRLRDKIKGKMWERSKKRNFAEYQQKRKILIDEFVRIVSNLSSLLLELLPIEKVFEELEDGWSEGRAVSELGKIDELFKKEIIRLELDAQKASAATEESKNRVQDFGDIPNPEKGVSRVFRKVTDYFTSANANRTEEKRRVQIQLKDDLIDEYRRGENGLKEIRQQLEDYKKALQNLYIYRKIILELKQKNKIEWKKCLEKNAGDEKKFGSDFGTMGSKIYRDLARAENDTEVLKSFKLKISHWILLVEKRHIAPVMEAMKDKPELMKRVLVFDNSIDRNSNSDPLNYYFKNLCTSQNGALLLAESLKGNNDSCVIDGNVRPLLSYVETLEKEAA